MKFDLEIIMIGLLIVLCILVALQKYPIEIKVTDCPEVVCKSTECLCRIEVINRTEYSCVNLNTTHTKLDYSDLEHSLYIEGDYMYTIFPNGSVIPYW